MAFEFGVFHEFQRRPGQSEAEAFTTAFEQVDAAERWGLDAIWLAEIHMAPERSVCSVPMTIASAIAARTNNIKIGTGVQVLPLCQPLRLAEDSADRRSYQPWPADLRGRPQRLPARLRGLRHPLWRKPRALCRSARNRQASLDRGKVFVRRQILQLRKRLHRAKAVPQAASADPDRGQSRGYVHFGRRSRVMRSLSGRAAAPLTRSCRICRPTARPGKPPATRARAKSICAPRCMSGTPSNRRFPTPRRA